jgi:hypothetical protein
LIASVTVFVLYLAGGVAFAVWGLRLGGRKTVVYPIIEGALSALGIAVSVIIYFTFGKLSGIPADDPEYIEWASEAFSVFVKAAVIVWAIVAAIGGLRLLVRLAEKRKSGIFGNALDFAAPFIGSAVIFVIAAAARSIFFDLTPTIGFEISAFAVSASFGLRFLLALSALIGRRIDREDNDENKQG